MKITYFKNEVEVSDLDRTFSLESIRLSGQCFRITKLENSKYAIVAKGRLLIAEQYSDRVVFHCNQEDFDTVWEDYFDLDYDYKKCIIEGSRYDAFLKSAVHYGSGIRILKQDPWEMLITFIISQQNNIPRIAGIVDKLCNRCGDLIATYDGINYYSFPTAEQIMDHYLELKDIGVGFRDKYILDACRRINSGYDLEVLKQVPPEQTTSELKRFYGVGDKVANCVSLFGLGHKDAFPRDVWINRIIDKYYNGDFDISRFEGFSGIIQQYMFYYERSITK